MKAPIVEKSTLKGIIIGFSICCLLSLTVFVSKAVNFEAYRINSPEKELTQEKWNSLVTTGIEKFLNKYNDEDLYKYKFPIGTVVMYAKSGGCPKGWEQWGDGLDGKFIMPLQTSDGTALMYGGSKSFTILNENLPKHSHKFIYDGQGSAGVSESTYLALNNYGNQNYGDYDLKFNSNVATVGLTSREGGDEPIEFMPKYAKVLFCIKVSDVGGEQEEEEEGNNGGEQQEVVQQYTVKFNANGGLGTMSEQKFNAGDSITLTPNGFMKEGYTFNGWNTESDGSGTPYTDQQKITINSDLKLYAVWKENEVVQYTVTFNANGGAGTMSQQVFKDGVSQQLSSNGFTRVGYTFNGWNTKSDGSGTPYTNREEITISSNLTLYAIWGCQYPEVTITETSDSVTISQGIISITVSKTNAYMSSQDRQYYQWGNNYGHKVPIPSNQLQASQLNAGGVNPSTYSDDMFVTTYVFTNDWTTDGDWSSVQNDNLWGNETDTDVARKGPCQAGWHVPTYEEWSNVIQMWNNKVACSDDSTMAKQPGLFMNKFNIFDVGHIWAGEFKQNEGGLWTSTPYYRGAYALKIGESYSMLASAYRFLGYNVRCFKNKTSNGSISGTPNITNCPSMCKLKGGYCIRTCFTAGTKVAMADGTQKNIEDVRIGERLLSASGTNKVLGYYRPKLGNRYLWSINGGEYFVSDEHPFMTTEGWKSFNPEMTKMEVDLDVTQLKVGDILVKANGYEKIETIDYISSGYNTQLYNFVLDGDHTYYADGYLVHNKQNADEYVVDSSNPDSWGSCGSNRKFAVAGDTKVCCPKAADYYGEGSVCYLMCPITTYSRD